MDRKTILVFFNTTVQFLSSPLVSSSVQVPVWSCSPPRPCTTSVTCLMPSGRVFNISPRITFVILGDDILCFYVHAVRICIIVFTRSSAVTHRPHHLLCSRRRRGP